jgi:hypothetical protein
LVIFGGKKATKNKVFLFSMINIKPPKIRNFLFLVARKKTTENNLIFQGEKVKK